MLSGARAATPVQALPAASGLECSWRAFEPAQQGAAGVCIGRAAHALDTAQRQCWRTRHAAGRGGMA